MSIRDEADASYKEEQKSAYKKLNEEKYTEDKYNVESSYYGARKYKYKTPVPASVSGDLAERNQNSDIPMININGSIMEASRVINVNLARSMVEMIDKHGNKYRLDATEILKMAREKQFIATVKTMKGNLYYYLTLKE